MAFKSLELGILGLSVRSKIKINFCFVCFLYFILYISTISLWRNLFGPFNVFRLVFYALSFVFAILFFIQKRLDAIIVFFFIYSIYCVFSLVLANNGGDVFDTLYSYILLPSLFFTFAFLLSKLRVVPCIKTIVIICSILSLMAIYEYITGRFFLGVSHSAYLSDGITQMYRTQVFADSCLSFACQLAVSTVLSFSLLFLTKNPFYLVATVVNFGAMLTTGSRGPMIGCIIGLLFFVLARGFDSKKRVFFFLLVIIGALIFIFFLLNLDTLLRYSTSNPMLERIMSTFDWKGDAGNNERMMKWDYYMGLFAEKPLFGYGLLYISAYGIGVTESGIIQRLIEIGIFGLVLYFLFVLSICFYAFFGFKNAKKSKKIIIMGCICASVSIFVEDFVLQIFTSTIVNVLLWFCLSVVYRLCKDGIYNHEQY